MSVEQNKTVVRRFFEEIINGGNYDVADEIMGAGVESHSFPGLFGPEGVKEIMRAWDSTFANSHFTIHHEIAEGDLVLTHWTFTATHQGEYAGIAPSGKPIKFDGVGLWRVADGKVVEHWTYYDKLDMVQQMGATVGPG